ncbi:MAG: oxidoreductase [Rhodospirillaceae bacterium]|nr:oxidoreductase [Rhodospirillaceae bacterium]|tara:strand:+ start:2561 stop:3424 length:864 start_codon:yes stop_codon:yes gene_type:complete
MRYEAPDTLDAAVGLLSSVDGTARVLAGGTDLLVQLRAGMVEPDLVVDIKRVPGMDAIIQENGGFRVGAAVPGAVLGQHAALKAAWPGVVEATELIGSTQIQGRATMTGNLCNASPAADSVPAMIAAGALARIHGPDGQRDVAVEDICTGPGKTSLGKGVLIGSVFLPARPTRSSDAYLRFIPRTEMDIAVVGAGVSLTLADDGTVSSARVALGAVAPTALLVDACADAIVGSSLDDTALDNLATAASAACNPIDDKRGTVAYRTKVAGVLARRAAVIARARAGESS